MHGGLPVRQHCQLEWVLLFLGPDDAGFTMLCSLSLSPKVGVSVVGSGNEARGLGWVG